ncbi:MAG: twin-arginine translocase TatA/TatE family subunit [Alphaproteobacteria bacterium GM7ARS4]|nr:twin-arginine translocase TatA/TatE family subunit [Alphaproteobacteria bacterium GM7ARS4]
MSIGPWQVILILVLIFVIFGARRLPQAMHDVAAGIRSFREGLSGEATANEKDDKQALSQKTTQKSSSKHASTSTTKES